MCLNFHVLIVNCPQINWVCINSRTDQTSDTRGCFSLEGLLRVRILRA